MENNKNIITIDKESELFPHRLKEIKDCPDKLYCIGNVELLSMSAIAVVGSRKTTQYGRNTAREIGDKLGSRGVAIVSGMAAGIDTCAHEGALKHDNKTIAVLGCGPDICYPQINYKLKSDIERRGLVISEYKPGVKPERYYFPMRNRIISGMCDATVVVQAGARSGAMITAELAIEQNRDVYAVPGNIDSQYNLGSNKLIRDGAYPVLNVNDLLNNLGFGVIDEDEAEKLLSSSELEIYNLLREHGELTADELCIMTDTKPNIMAKMIAIMELKGIIFQDIGKVFIAK